MSGDGGGSSFSHPGTKGQMLLHPRLRLFPRWLFSFSPCPSSPSPRPRQTNWQCLARLAAQSAEMITFADLMRGGFCEAVMQKGATPPDRCNVWAATEQALVATACCGYGRLSVDAVVGRQWGVHLLRTVTTRNKRPQRSTSERSSSPNNYQNLKFD